MPAFVNVRPLFLPAGSKSTEAGDSKGAVADERLFTVAALILGVGFLCLTPPFKVPDEVGHFWHAEAIAAGHLLPNGGGRADSANLPQGLKTLVWVMLQSGDFRTAYAIPLEPLKEPSVQFPQEYTPLPYLPQALAAGVCRLLNVRPLIAFYAGRLAALIAGITLCLLAMRIAPAMSPIIAAVGLLPMTLDLFASWSPDVITISSSILLTAMLLAEREPPLNALIVVAFAQALCKGYFLIAAMIFVVSKSRRRIAAVIGASFAGAAASFAYLRAGYYHQRGTDLPIDFAQQLRCVAANPSHFLGVGFHDVMTNGSSYVEEMIGRLGMLDVRLPPGIIIVEVSLLIMAGLLSRIMPGRAGRIVAVSIVAVIVISTIMLQYFTWSVICGDAIEGVQGRYFLPVLPLALSAISIPRFRWRPSVTVVVAVAACCDAVALAVLWGTYW